MFDEILGVFGINWKILVFQIINFGLLLAVLYHFLYKPLSKILEERKNKIEDGLKKADEANILLSEADRNKKDIITKATKEADDVISSAKKGSERMKSELIIEAEAKKNEIISKAKERAEAEREKILEDGKKEIAKLAVLATEKILRER